MKIKNIFEVLEDWEIPLVNENEAIKKVLKKMLRYPHTRLIYVVDENGICKGTISLGSLIRYLFPHGFEPVMHTRSLISMITSETAQDIMNRGLIYATNNDNAESVIERMIKAGVKEIAILDSKKRVVADLTMLDLLKYYHLGGDT